MVFELGGEEVVGGGVAAVDGVVDGAVGWCCHHNGHHFVDGECGEYVRFAVPQAQNVELDSVPMVAGDTRQRQDSGGKPFTGSSSALIQSRKNTVTSPSGRRTTARFMSWVAQERRR